MNKYFHGCVYVLLIILSVATASIDVLAAPLASENPIPRDTLVVLWIRPALISSDPALNALTSDLGAVFSTIQMLNLTPDKIDQALLFGPFDMGWISGPHPGIPLALAPSTGLILKGNFNADTQYRSLKSKGWKEKEYEKKKMLLWSRGEKYLSSPSGAQSIAALPGDRLVIGGSEDVLREMLDVDGGKKPGIGGDPTFQHIAGQFAGNINTALSVYGIVTEPMRSLLRPLPQDQSNNSSGAANTAINTLRTYSSHVKECGLSLAATAGGYQVNGVLTLDSDNSAALVSGVFQFSGGIANFLPQNDPARAVIAALQVSRQGNLIDLQSIMTRQQFNEIIMRRR